MPDQLVVAPLVELHRRRSAKWRMHPPDVLPVSIAEMDFDVAEPISAALHAAVDRADLGYADQFDDLADAYAGFASRTFDWMPDREGITAVTDVGVGAVEVVRALQAQRVIISSPVYPPFLDWVPEAGADIVDVPLLEGRLDLEELDRAFADGGAYLLCNPQNPTGTVHTSDELATLVEAAHRHGITIISDEIHAPLGLPGARVVPILALPGADEVAIALTSASKTWNLAGLKTALVLTSSRRLRGVVQRLPPDTRWRVGSLGVLAATAAFAHGDDWRQQLLTTLDDRRDYFVRLVADHLPELDLAPPAATYLAWLSTGPSTSGEELRDATLEHGRVAVEAGEKFGAGGARHIRVNLATSRELLERAVVGIRAGLDRLHPSAPNC